MKCKIAFFAIVAKLISIFIWDALVANFQIWKTNAITHSEAQSLKPWAEPGLHLWGKRGSQWAAFSLFPPFTLTFPHQFILLAKFLHVLTLLPKAALTDFNSLLLLLLCGQNWPAAGPLLMAQDQSTSPSGDCTRGWRFLCCKLIPTGVFLSPLLFLLQFLWTDLISFYLILPSNFWP